MNDKVYSARVVYTPSPEPRQTRGGLRYDVKLILTGETPPGAGLDRRGYVTVWIPPDDSSGQLTYAKSLHSNQEVKLAANPKSGGNVSWSFVIPSNPTHAASAATRTWSPISPNDEEIFLAIVKEQGQLLLSAMQAIFGEIDFSTLAIADMRAIATTAYIQAQKIWVPGMTLASDEPEEEGDGSFMDDIAWGSGSKEEFIGSILTVLVDNSGGTINDKQAAIAALKELGYGSKDFKTNDRDTVARILEEAWAYKAQDALFNF